MITQKIRPKIGDLEKAIADLEQSIRQMPYPSQAAVLSLIKEFKAKVITYVPHEEIEVYEFMR